MKIDDVSKENILLYSRMYNVLRFVGSGDLVNCLKYGEEIDFYSKLLDSFDNSRLEEYNFVCKFLHNRYTKKSRYYRYIEFMLNNYDVCFFCTFTFDNEHIDLSLKYKRDFLTQLLKSLNTSYMGNVDYGDLNGRMHFHVIIAQNNIKINKDNVKWPFGYYDIQVIHNKDPIRLGSYIMKLVNHATKETTKNSLITPRGEYSFPNLMKKK